MKQKIYLSAITVVIAGLLIVGTTGFAAQLNTETINKNEPIEVEFDLDTAIVKASSSKISLASAEMAQIEKQAIAEVQSKSIDAEIRTFTPEQTRQTILSFAEHPGLTFSVDDPYSYGILGYEIDYTDFLNPDDNLDTVMWVGTDDYGTTNVSWSENGVYLINSTTEEPYEWEYPSGMYWGQNGTDPVWYYTWTGEPGSGEVWYLKFQGAPGNISEALRLDESVLWDWTDAGLTNINSHDLDCSDKYDPEWRGPIALYITDGPDSDIAAFFIQNISDLNWAQMFSWSNVIDGEHCSGTLDDTTHYHYGAWDCIWTAQTGDPAGINREMIIGKTNCTDPSGDEANEGWIYYWPVDENPELSLINPEFIAHDNGAIMAVEMWNTSEPEINYLDMIKFSDGTLGAIDNESVWYINTTTYPEGGYLENAELRHVEGDTFVLEFILDITGGTPIVVLGVTYDHGVNWYLYADEDDWSGDDVVVNDYRSCDFSDDGAVSIWCYEFDEGDAVGFRMHYKYVTYTLDGQVKYEEGNPVDPAYVEVTNENTSMVYIPGVDTGYYAMKAIRDFDLWQDAEFSFYGEDIVGMWGETLHTFDDFDPLTFVYTNDIVVMNPPIPDVDPDASSLDLTDEIFPGMTTDPDGDWLPKYAHAKVTAISAITGLPIAGLPANLFSFTVSEIPGDTEWANTLDCDFEAVDPVTNATGEIRFTIRAQSTIVNNITIEVTVGTTLINDAEILRCKSMDYAFGHHPDHPDGTTAPHDLAKFVADYVGGAGTAWTSDFDWDGDVDPADLAQFVGHWQEPN